MKDGIETDLIGRAVKAVRGIGKKDDAATRALRSKLKGGLALADLSRASGLRDLRLSGFDGNEDERAARSSVALASLIKRGEFSQLTDMPERENTDAAERRVATQMLLMEKPGHWWCQVCWCHHLEDSEEVKEARECSGPCRVRFCGRCAVVNASIAVPVGSANRRQSMAGVCLTCRHVAACLCLKRSG